MRNTLSRADKRSDPSLQYRRRVGLPRRMGAMVYDGLLLSALLFFASIVVVVPFDITLEHPFYPLYVAYVYILSFLFFGWFWTHGGQTLGMKTWRFRVEQDDGRAMTWPAALLRFLSAIISWLPFGAGFIWCLFSRDRLTFHDAFSGTRLIRIGEPDKLD
jgi:uncharacterized RDD family membrane protein YckC